MKRSIIVVAISAAMLLSLAAPAFAATYNYNGTFENVVYATPTFRVTGTTKVAGSQKQVNGTQPCGVQYALVNKAGSDPALDTVYTYKSIYGTVGYSYSFASISKSNVRLRFKNIYYEGLFGNNKQNTAGTFTGSFAIQ